MPCRQAGVAVSEPITSTAVGALADWAAFRAGVTRFMTANAASAPGEVRALIRPELWDYMDGVYMALLHYPRVRRDCPLPR